MLNEKEYSAQENGAFENEGLEAATARPPFSEINALGVIQAPVPSEWVKTRKSGKQELSYVSGDTVTRILNKAFRGRWSFQIKETRVVQAQDKKGYQGGEDIPQGQIIQVLGSMTVPGWGVREQWGAQVLSGGADVQEHAFKAASTDAMKKCASMFGVALDLYGMVGADSLMITPEDFLRDDELAFQKLREKIKGAQQENRQPSEPDLDNLAETEQQTEEVNNPAPVATEGPAMDPEPQHAPQAESVAQPVEVPWDPQDIIAMKEIMSRLGMKKNAELNPYVEQFMQSPEATIQHHIRPHNVKDFIIYMENTLRQQQNA